MWFKRLDGCEDGSSQRRWRCDSVEKSKSSVRKDRVVEIKTIHVVATTRTGSSWDKGRATKFQNLRLSAALFANVDGTELPAGFPEAWLLDFFSGGEEVFCCWGFFSIWRAC